METAPLLIRRSRAARSPQPVRRVHRDLRAVGEKGRAGSAGEEGSERLPEESEGLALHARALSNPDVPSRMGDAVLLRPSAASPGVSPRAVRDELRLAAGSGRVGRTLRDELHPPLAAAAAPEVADEATGVAGLRLVADAGGRVVLAVERPRRPGDGGTRHQLLHEDDAVPPSLFSPAPHVEAQ